MAALAPAVDHRPLLARKADLVVRVAVLGILGLGLLGAGVGASIAVYLTTPPKGAPQC